jgi:hypothetical protein
MIDYKAGLPTKEIDPRKRGCLPNRETSETPCLTDPEVMRKVMISLRSGDSSKNIRY